jgi:hypothetical protein
MLAYAPDALLWLITERNEFNSLYREISRHPCPAISAKFQLKRRRKRAAARPRLMLIISLAFTSAEAFTLRDLLRLESWSVRWETLGVLIVTSSCS